MDDAEITKRGERGDAVHAAAQMILGCRPKCRPGWERCRGAMRRSPALTPQRLLLSHSGATDSAQLRKPPSPQPVRSTTNVY